MQTAGKHLAISSADTVPDRRGIDTDRNVLNEIVRMLPAAVTVQDDQGRFLLVNEAAAAQFKLPATDLLAASETVAATDALPSRRDTCIELLRTGRGAVLEECFGDGPFKRTFLTEHRPVRIAGTDLLLTAKPWSPPRSKLAASATDGYCGR